MRIVLASDTYPPDVNGAAIFTGRLAIELASRGHQVHEIAPSPNGRPFVGESDGVVIHRMPSRRYPWHPTFHIASPRKTHRIVPEILHDIRPNVVHVQSHFVIGRCVASAATQMQIPWIATNHFMPENLESQIPMPLPRPIFRLAASLAWRDLGRVYRNANTITSPTPVAADLLRRRAGISGAAVISCGVDTSVFMRTNIDAAETSPSRILFVGRLEREKCITDIIDALPLVGPQITVRIVGEGSQEAFLRRRAHNAGVVNRVEFLGFLDENQLRIEYARAHVFCMPGIAELQSIATLEAMAFGLPIVAADAQALPHLVHSGTTFPDLE